MARSVPVGDEPPGEPPAEVALTANGPCGHEGPGPTDVERDTDPVALLAEVRAVGLDGGLVAVGVADAAPFVDARTVLDQRRAAGLHGGMQFTYRNPARSTDPERILSGARSIVAGALPYASDLPPADPRAGPQAAVARYATDDHYADLRAVLLAIAAVLTGAGYRARVVADDNALVDRAAAHRAGIGWWGKNTNLLVPGHGSWVVLGSVVTDAPLASSGGPLPDGCGPCRRCIDGCPTGAIVAPGVLDAGRCLAWLVQAVGVFPRRWRTALGDRIYGCDECQVVCPPSRPGRAPKAWSSPSPAPPPDAASPAPPVPSTPVRLGADPGTLRHRGAWVALLDVLEASDDDLLERFGRWYIPRRDPRYLRRNALVALGNVADPSDEAVLRCLRRYLDHADPLLRGHAVWASRRLGHDDLAQTVRDPSEPLVAAELAAEVGRAR